MSRPRLVARKWPALPHWECDAVRLGRDEYDHATARHWLAVLADSPGSVAT